MATATQELIETVLVRFAKLLDGPISVDIPDDLLLVDIDYVMVEQVLANLLENVARHCPPCWRPARVVPALRMTIRR